MYRSVDAMTDRHVCQVALCALNAAQLRDWYRTVFGLARGSGALLAVPPMPTRRIQGVDPNPAETVTWLVDQQAYFQLEFFQFHRPRSVLKPTNWRPCDIGYNVVGIYVSDFEQTLHRYAACSDRSLPEPMGPPGDRRVCVADPEGNWIEIMERDPIAEIDGCESGKVRPELGAALRFIRVSVPDLARAQATFIDAMGLQQVDGLELHTPDHEALWGLPGAVSEAVVLKARNFLVELVAYRKPEPQPRPEGYQISDQGFMNIALGFDTAGAFDSAFAQATSRGMSPNGSPVDIGIFRVMYVNDSDGFSVEMLYARKPLWWLSGFSPGEPYVESELRISASPALVWSRLTDNGNLGRWSVFRSRVLRPGRDTPDGEGCLRQLSICGLRFVEEVVDWHEGSRYRYRLRSGAPFSWHQGDVFLSEENGATRVRWAVRFESRIPFTGRMLGWILERAFSYSLARLKRQLESPE